MARRRQIVWVENSSKFWVPEFPKSYGEAKALNDFYKDQGLNTILCYESKRDIYFYIFAIFITSTSCIGIAFLISLLEGVI